MIAVQGIALFLKFIRNTWVNSNTLNVKAVFLNLFAYMAQITSGKIASGPLPC